MRSAEPSNALLALECFFENGSKVRYLTTAQLAQFLMKKANFTKSQAWEAIGSLVKDRILIKANEMKNNNKSQNLRLFLDEDLEVLNHDCYCFECFLPGELIKCYRCTRVFHLSCIRKYPERPNYVIPPTNMIDEYEDETEIDASSSNVSLPTPTQIPSPQSEHSQVRPCKVVLVDIMHLKSEIHNQSIEKKFEFPDVTYMGQIRPPTRQRLRDSDTPNHLKNELNTIENELESRRNEEKLCTCCQLLEKGQLMQPPNLLIDELHHLLGYAFKRCRAWDKRDIYKKIENRMIPESYFELLIKKLFKRLPIMTLDMIFSKIKNMKYKLLVEIHNDFLEYQYATGVLFGSASLEFDFTKYLVRDLSYDLAEIKRCPDCYRHSYDQLTTFWFALPCVQRHELVFAKCPGHAFWPAKVIRVLKNAEKYDVRFFGGNHERSLVNAVNIRSIDALNIPFPKLVSFKTAMNELQCYRTLIEFAPARFGFHASRDDILNIIENVIGAIDIAYKKPQKRRLSKHTRINQQFLNSTLMSENETDSEACSSTRISNQTKRSQMEKRRRGPPKLLRLENSSIADSSISAISSPAPTPVHSNSHAAGSYITVEQHIAEMNALRDQLNELHQRELVIAKLKPYCVKCLQPAKFLCCIQAWYCSSVCQRQHWYEEHEKHCDNIASANNES